MPGKHEQCPQMIILCLTSSLTSLSWTLDPTGHLLPSWFHLPGWPPFPSIPAQIPGPSAEVPSE